MPRGDRRGPEARGSMTGRGFRNGAGRGPGFGRGCAFAGGEGRGRRMGYGFGPGRGAAYIPADEEIDYDSEENKNREITRLENLANTLSSELEITKKQLEELKNN